MAWFEARAARQSSTVDIEPISGMSLSIRNRFSWLILNLHYCSLKEAATSLAITPAALGQRIRTIEDYLGFDLIVRSRSGTRATKELESALAHLSAGFGEERGSEHEDALFRDYLAPVGSPANAKRISGQPKNTMLEGFPLLHLDCYTLNGGGIGWPEWIGKYGYRKTSPGLGIRYKKTMHALEAVYADAGFLICGLGLVGPKIEDRQLDTPFPIEEGQWSSHSYRIEFQRDSLRRKQTENFRDWLLIQAEASKLELEEMVGHRA